MTHRRGGAGWVLLGAAAGCAMLASCAGRAPAPPDPLTDFQDPKLPVPRRVEALDQAWAGSRPGEREETRSALKAIAWSTEAPTELRLAALAKLVDDPQSEADARKTARLMLPQEPRLEVVELIGDAAVRHGWTELTPALVRSYSRPTREPDEQRPERRALLALNPGKTPEQIAFGVFISPTPSGVDADPRANFGLDYAQRTRAAAWDLLARLDADGSARAAMLASEFAAHPTGTPELGQDRVLADLRACLNDLRTVPITGEELTWLASLRDPSDRANAAWWAESASAIARLTPDQAAGLRLRHAEAVRWAGASRLEWLAADRAALLTELRARLKGRDVHPRSVRADESKPLVPERLADWEGRLAWGDVLAMLVIDEALHDPAVLAQVFDQARDDFADRTTEYGGLLWLPPDGFKASLYPPRPSQRAGDERFVASADMIDQGDRAVAHYHFHVRAIRSSSYSGPSEGDLAFAGAFGRGCIVFTSITQGVLSADYYQPGGVVVDLGQLRVASASSR